MFYILFLSSLQGNQARARTPGHEIRRNSRATQKCQLLASASLCALYAGMRLQGRLWYVYWNIHVVTLITILEGDGV